MTSSQNTQNVQSSLSGANQQKIGSSIVLKSLSILLGLFFIFIGAMKLTPHLSKELHKDLVSQNERRQLQSDYSLVSLVFFLLFGKCVCT